MTTTKKPPHCAVEPVNPTMAELRRVVLASEKFRSWKAKPKPLPDLGISAIVAEKHYTPQELAELWGVSVQTVRELFKDEEGVLKIGSNGTRTRRGYKTLRIPESVAERVHAQLSA
jgi:hypothetical protein